MEKKPKLAITMGDPGGIGSEIVIKALKAPAVNKICIPVVIGDSSVFNEASALLNYFPDMHIVNSTEAVASIQRKTFFFDIHAGKRYLKKRPSRRGGAATVRYIEKAVEMACKGIVKGIVTAPISKEALRMAGSPWPGHTEMLASLTASKQFAMMLVGGPLRVMLVTIHTALKNVPGMVSKKRVLQTIRLAYRATKLLRLRRPRIAVAGLNPHAGESGIFGDEETRIIIPSIRAAQREGIPVTGPYPPDTLFHKAYEGEIDIIVSMYHDQGLIPLKMIAFEKGVNITVGLPFIRTSPDHGTAYDIAWEGRANPSSMIEAIKCAASLTR